MQYPCKFADCAPPASLAVSPVDKREGTDDCCVVSAGLAAFSQKMGKGRKLFSEISKRNGQGFDI